MVSGPDIPIMLWIVAPDILSHTNATLHSNKQIQMTLMWHLRGQSFIIITREGRVENSHFSTPNMIKDCSMIWPSYKVPQCSWFIDHIVL